MEGKRLRGHGPQMNRRRRREEISKHQTSRGRHRAALESSSSNHSRQRGQQSGRALQDDGGQRWLCWHVQQGAWSHSRPAEWPGSKQGAGRASHGTISEPGTRLSPSRPGQRNAARAVVGGSDGHSSGHWALDSGSVTRWFLWSSGQRSSPVPTQLISNIKPRLLFDISGRTARGVNSSPNVETVPFASMGSILKSSV